MRTAVRRGEVLAAPTVGRWAPRIGPGAPLEPGQVLGTLLRAGRTVDVTAPNGTSGHASRVSAAGWVAWGDPLVTIGHGAVSAGDAQADEDPDAPPTGVTAVRADTDGTVYLSPQPGSPAFAPPGAAVAHHETLALVEVMKTFTPVRSPVSGVVDQVLVDDGSAVSAGQALFWVRADVG